MRARLPSVPLMLTAASLTLCTLLAYQLLAPIADFDVPDPAPRAIAPRTLSLPLFSVPPFSQFTDADDRPLFVPERRWPKIVVETPVEEAPTEKPRMRPSITLVGVILDRERKLAVAKREGSPALYLTIGALLDGWEVTAIEASHIALTAGSDSFEIPLPKATPGTASQTLARIPTAQPPRPGPPQSFSRPPDFGR